MYTHSEVATPTDNRAKKRFMFFSLIGLLLFITPIPWNGNWGVGVGILAGILKSFLPANTLPTVALFIVVFSSFVTAIALIFKPKIFQTNRRLQEIFLPSKIWIILRMIGAVFIVMIYFKIGPE